MRLFVDQLTNVDFSYLCPARGLLGETWLASIQLVGPLDEQGMICDFGKVKKFLRQWLDDTLDHKLLLPTLSERLQYSQASDHTQLNFNFGTAHLHTRGPTSAFCPIPVPTITPESVAAWCQEQFTGQFGDQISQIALHFSPENIAGPHYQYSHGLKKHLGNCQRIAHGHRSKIEVWRNGQLCLDSMRNIAELWHDIYIGTRADLVQQDTQYYEFTYTAAQGPFHLRLPKSCVYLMDEDTTVENISRHLAQRLKQQNPNDQLTVKAFEGLGKGAEVSI
jgi:6-pyruvoyl-tetrahydropterin synthase